MLIAIDTEIRDLGGKVLLNDEVPATLKTIAIESLLAVFKDEENLSGDEKLKRWQLAVKIKEATGTAELTVEEVAKVKNLIGKAYSPLVVGQAWTILEARPPLTVVKETE